MPQQIMDDVDITTTTTRITITALATSKFLYGQLIHDIVPPVKKEFTLSCYDGLQLPYPSSLFYVEGVRMSFYNGKE
ncbi:MAG: hypothetical protein HUJ68_00140 [Clostridia bacterium]|nr:hypothetical protein [Clostridia bacterium]